MYDQASDQWPVRNNFLLQYLNLMHNNNSVISILRSFVTINRSTEQCKDEIPVCVQLLRLYRVLLLRIDLEHIHKIPVSHSLHTLCGHRWLNLAIFTGLYVFAHAKTSLFCDFVTTLFSYVSHFYSAYKKKKMIIIPFTLEHCVHGWKFPIWHSCRSSFGSKSWMGC